MARRYWREKDGDIYDRETGKTIEVREEKDCGNSYAIRGKGGWQEIKKDDIEEPR